MPIALGCTLLLGAVAAPAAAAPEADTRLVRCGADTCVRVTGRRADPAVMVKINGHAVAAQGGRGWQVDLPLDTVRDWSPRYARSIEVSLLHPGGEEARTEVDLPIGVLGGATQLASLVVSLR